MHNGDMGRPRVEKRNIDTAGAMPTQQWPHHDSVAREKAVEDIIKEM